METSTKYNRYAARIPKGMGVKGFGVGEGVVGSLSFSQGRGEGVRSCPGEGGGEGLPNSDPFGQTEKGGKGEGAKIGHFSWIS